MSSKCTKDTFIHNNTGICYRPGWDQQGTKVEKIEAVWAILDLCGIMWKQRPHTWYTRIKGKEGG
jgi:hypothetical protein